MNRRAPAIGAFFVLGLVVFSSARSDAQTALRPIGAVCDLSSACTTNVNSGEFCISQDNYGTPPSQLTNGSAHEWFGGYCSKSCTPGAAGCPAGSVCSPTNSRLPQFACLKSCTVGGNECRGLPYYTCDPSYAAAGATAPSPVCVPSCFNDADCQQRLNTAQAACRLCDRRCVPRNSPDAQIGDRCSVDSQCGTGQTCLKLATGTDGICSQSCGGGVVCACPTGSSCQAAGPSGESYCLRTCASGSCPAGLTCAGFGTTRACLPPCSSDSQCPVNLKCQQGACRGTTADGGCALCGGGTGSVPTFNPGGGSATPSAPSSGGCAVGGPGMLGMLAFGAMLVPLSRRKRP